MTVAEGYSASGLVIAFDQPDISPCAPCSRLGAKLFVPLVGWPSHLLHPALIHCLGQIHFKEVRDQPQLVSRDATLSRLQSFNGFYRNSCLPGHPLQRDTLFQSGLSELFGHFQDEFSHVHSRR